MVCQELLYQQRNNVILIAVISTDEYVTGLDESPAYRSHINSGNLYRFMQKLTVYMSLSTYFLLSYNSESCQGIVVSLLEHHIHMETGWFLGQYLHDIVSYIISIEVQNFCFVPYGNNYTECKAYKC